MRKILLGVLGSAVMATAFADDPQAAAAPAMVDDASINQSYAQIADLKTKMEFYQTQIDVEQLQQELSAMQGKQSVSFKVLRIEGFETIKVWFLGVDGSVVEAGPGDVIYGDYRVSQIKPSEVRVINIPDGTLYTVPFAKAQDIAAANASKTTALTPAVIAATASAGTNSASTTAKKSAS